MKKTIVSIYKMLIVVDDYFTSTATEVNAIEGLKASGLTLSEKLAKLKDLDAALEMLPTRPAAVKTKLESAMDTLLMFNARKHVAYAVKVDDLELELKVTLSKSSLKRLDDRSKLSFGRSLYALNATNLANLNVHGLNASTQTTFLETMDAFENAIPKTRENTSIASTIRADFENLVLETLVFVRSKVDKLVAGADDDKSEFVTNYFSNRKIIDLPSFRKALRGTVKSSKTGEAIFGVRITVDKTVLKSTALGNFGLAHKTQGVYPIRFEKAGYKTTEREVVIGAAGETTVLNVVLETE